MRNSRQAAVALLALSLVLLPAFAAWPEQGADPAKPAAIAVGEADPAVWGRFYPLQAESWGRTKEPRPAGQSRYKPGWDADRVIYDKLSEYPWMALLYNGWGFGIEYNEPRGHWYMLIDQGGVDPSRVKSGGACITCKSSDSERLRAEKGAALYAASYADAVKMLPEGRRELGVSCPTCHSPADASLSLERKPLLDALAAMGKGAPTKEELRSLVCAQCHVTYVLTRDSGMKVTSVIFPWQGARGAQVARWGDIGVEGIVAQIQSSPANLEWKQAVTGFALGAVRHPEFEFFSRGSPHWENGVACADCHMPRVKAGGSEISDHDIMSPLKNGLVACGACHDDGPAARKAKVLAIQDKTVALLNRAGYATATVARLFEMANKAKEGGKVVEQGVYDAAKSDYLAAYYRVNFIGAENSMGFHNPAEAARILTDALAAAGRAEVALRAGLVKAGAPAPDKVDLELARYLENRGVRKLGFKPEQEFKTPAP
jgi:nitrite reductase (cytochrome c-552)